MTRELRQVLVFFSYFHDLDQCYPNVIQVFARGQYFDKFINIFTQELHISIYKRESWVKVDLIVDYDIDKSTL